MPPPRPAQHDGAGAVTSREPTAQSHNVSNRTSRPSSDTRGPNRESQWGASRTFPTLRATRGHTGPSFWNHNIHAGPSQPFRLPCPPFPPPPAHVTLSCPRVQSLLVRPTSNVFICRSAGPRDDLQQLN